MTENFEKAFIQCLNDGVYPGPANINERFRKDKKRINRLNGQYTKMRLALMYEFGVPYQRGNPIEFDPRLSYAPTKYSVGEIPEWPYLASYDLLGESYLESKPEQGHRKHEILRDTSKPWELKRK